MCDFFFLVPSHMTQAFCLWWSLHLIRYLCIPLHIKFLNLCTYNTNKYFWFSRLYRQLRPIFRITHTTLFLHPGFLANCCACCSVTPHQKMVLSKVVLLSVLRQFSIRHRSHQNPKKCSTLMQRTLSCLKPSRSSSTMTGEPPLNKPCMSRLHCYLMCE